MLSQCVNIVWVWETARQRGNNYVSPFVSAPSIKPEERQPDSMSTYPLKFPQQKAPLPPPVYLSPLTLPPTLNALSHNKLLFIALFSKYIFLSSCLGLQQCLPPPHTFLLQPCLTSRLFVGLTESPPHPPFSSLSLSLLHALLQGTERGRKWRGWTL